MPAGYLLFIGCAVCLSGCYTNSPRPKYATDSLHSKVFRRVFYNAEEELPDFNSHRLWATSYRHYVIVENFDSFSQCRLTKQEIDSYRDTCTSGLPVREITFCRPFQLRRYGDSRDWFQVRAHAFIQVIYRRAQLAKAHPQLQTVVACIGGNSTQSVDLPYDTTGEFDNLGHPKNEWMKEVDAKFGTHYWDYRYGFDSMGIIARRRRKQQ